jgi:hypothetical protein
VLLQAAGCCAGVRGVKRRQTADVDEMQPGEGRWRGSVYALAGGGEDGGGANAGAGAESSSRACIEECSRRSGGRRRELLVCLGMAAPAVLAILARPSIFHHQ